MAIGPTGQRTSNEVKFQTGNPVVQRMIAAFFRNLGELVEPLDPASVLDAGCGEGETIARMGDLLGDRIAAVDISTYCVERVAQRLPSVEVSEASVTELPFGDDTFDLVLCLEVIEHVPEPELAVAELGRVASRDVIISVPYEPYFQIGSLLRGKHVGSFGNHPEHVNHFNKGSLKALLEPTLELAEVRVAFPWLIAHGRVRS